MFQDMSKAYDRVNRKLLYKALDRICVPTEFNILLRNSLEGRSNKILTALGDTNEYIMKNGIDQGETISPLLWIIYYNPLFERIKKENIGAGYTMEFKPTKMYNSIQLKEEIFHIAYMDDTTWLAPNKNAISRSLKIADSFNSYTGIQVNTKKADLIVINSKEQVKSIKYGNDTHEIKAIENNKPVRFLGVWVSEYDNIKFIKTQVKDEIILTTNLLQRKHIMSQQIVYIFNAVIIPRIEYKMNLTLLNEKELDKLARPIRRLLRLKCGIANTLPNSILLKKEFYNLIDIYNRMLEHHTTNLLVNINNEEQLGKLLHIRIN